MRDASLAEGVVLERAEVELADVGASVDLEGGPEQFKNRATRLLRIAARIHWRAIERALASLGPVTLGPAGPLVRFELRYGRAKTPVASPVSLGPGRGGELEVVFGPAWVFGVPEGPTVRLAERVRQALVRATGGAAPAVARSFRGSGPTAFAFDWISAALWPAFPRRGLKIPEVPDDLGFDLALDEAGLRLEAVRGRPRRAPPGFPEAQATQVDLHRGQDAELLLARGRWSEAFEILLAVVERERGIAVLRDRLLELGLGVPELRPRVRALADAGLRSEPRWGAGRLARAIAALAAHDDVAGRRDLEQLARDLREVDAPTAGLALSAAARVAPRDDQVRLLESAVALRPDDPSILRDLLAILPALGRAPAALRAARRLARIATTPAERREALIAAGRVLRDGIGDPRQARAAFEEALENTPEDDVARSELAATLLRLGDVEAAVRHYEALADQAAAAGDDRAAARWWVEIADVYDRSADALRSLQSLERARRHDPEDLRLWARILAQARRADRTAWARARFEAAPAPEAGPAAAALLREAAELWREDEPERAAALLERARRADPEAREVLRALLQLEAERGGALSDRAAELLPLELEAADREGALDAWRRLEAAAPDDPRVDLWLEKICARWPEDPEGWRHRRARAAGRRDATAQREALEHLTRQLPPSPELGALWLERARLELDAGRSEAAETSLAEAARFTETRGEAAALRARLRLEAADPAGARAEIDAVLDGRLPDDTRRRLLALRAEAWVADGRAGPALADARAALEGTDPGPPWLRAAEIALEAGHPEDAERWAQAVDEVGAADPERTLRVRLRALEAKESEADATPLLRRLLTTLEPGSADARRVEGRLRAALLDAERFDDAAALDRAAAGRAAADPRERTERLMAAAEIALDHGDAHAADADAARAVEAAEAGGDRALLRRATRLHLRAAESRRDPSAIREARERLLALEPPERREHLYLEHAEALVDAGDLAAAGAALEAAAADAPHASPPAARRAELLREAGRGDEAAVWFAEAALRALASGRVREAGRLRAEAGAALHAIGDVDASAEHDRWVLALDEVDEDVLQAVLTRLIDGARDADDHEEVVSLLARAAEHAADPSALHLERGLVLSEALDRPDEAIDAWAEAWRSGVAGPTIADELSGLLAQRGRGREQLELEVARAEASADRDAAVDAWLRAARVAARSVRDLDRARACAETAVRLDPTRTDARSARLQLLREGDDPTALAEALVEEAQTTARAESSAQLWLEAAETVGASPSTDLSDPARTDALRRAHGYAHAAARTDPSSADAARGEVRWAIAAGVDATEALLRAEARAETAEARWAARWIRLRQRAERGEQAESSDALAREVDRRRGLDDRAVARALVALGQDAEVGEWPATLDVALELSSGGPDWTRHAEWLRERAEVAHDPEFAATLLQRRANILSRELEDPSESLSAITAATELKPADAEIREDYENALVDAGAFEQLIAELGPDALEARRAAWRAAGDPRALAAAEAMWPHYPAGSEARTQLLTELCRLPDDTGLRALEQLAEDGPQPQRAQALGALFDRYLEMDRAEDAVGVLRLRADAATSDAERAELCGQVAEVLLDRLGDPDGAEQEYLAALALDPTNERAARGLAALLGAQERFDALADDLGPSALRAVRDACLETGAVEAAISATDALVRNAPETAGEEWMRVAARLDDDDDHRPTLWSRAARAGSEAGLAALRQAFDTAPEAGLERERLAELLVPLVPDADKPDLLRLQAEAQDDDDAALGLLEEARALAPDRDDLRAAHGAALARAGRWDALAAEHGASALDPYLNDLEPAARSAALAARVRAAGFAAARRWVDGRAADDPAVTAAALAALERGEGDALVAWATEGPGPAAVLALRHPAETVEPSTRLGSTSRARRSHPMDPGVERWLELALEAATSVGPEAVEEVRGPWLAHYARGPAEARLVAIRRLIAATGGIQDAELLAAEIDAAVELGDWESAAYAIDSLFDTDAGAAEHRRSVAERVISAKAAPERLVERAWVELARPETARDDASQHAALLALADIAAGRGAEPGEVARPLEVSLGLDVPEEEHLRTRRRLRELFEMAGDWRGAERHLGAIAELAGRADDWIALAELRTWLDDPDGARAAIERAIALDTGHPAAHDLRVRLFTEAMPETRLEACLARARLARHPDTTARAQAWRDAVAVAGSLDPERAREVGIAAVRELPEDVAHAHLIEPLRAASPPGVSAELLDALTVDVLARWGVDAPVAARIDVASRREGVEALELLQVAWRGREPLGAPFERAWERALAALPEAENQAWQRVRPTSDDASTEDAPSTTDALAAAETDARAGRLARALERTEGLPPSPRVLTRRLEWLHRLGRDDDAARELQTHRSHLPRDVGADAEIRGLRWRWCRTGAPIIDTIRDRFDDLPAATRPAALALLVESGAFEEARAAADRCGSADPTIARLAASASLRLGDLHDALRRLAPHPETGLERAWVAVSAEDATRVAEYLDEEDPQASFASRLDRIWASVFLRTDRLGAPCADRLQAAREVIEAASDAELAAEVPRIRDLARRAERLGRPDDARALRARLAPFDPEGRAALLDAWTRAGRYDAVRAFFDAHPPSTDEDLEAAVLAATESGRTPEALAAARTLLEGDSDGDVDRFARRLALGARVALDAGEVVLGTDWGRLANWLRPGAFDPKRYAKIISSGPPTLDKIADLLAQLDTPEGRRARLDELERCLRALPDPRARARLAAERAIDDPDVDLSGVASQLDAVGLPEAAEAFLRRVGEDATRSLEIRQRAVEARIRRAGDRRDWQEVLQTALSALRSGLQTPRVRSAAVDAARRAGLADLELELLRRSDDGERSVEAATRTAVLFADERPLEAARALSRTLPHVEAPRRRTIIEHAARLLRRLRRPEAEADLWAHAASLAEDGASRAAAFSRLAELRARELDDRRGARAAWRAAVEASPSDLGARRGLVEAAVALGDRAEARHQAEEAARWAARQGRTEAAVSFLLEAAELAAEEGDDEEEAAVWRSLLQLRPDAAVVLDALVARARRADGTAHLAVLQAQIAELEPGFARGRLRVAAARILEQPLGRRDEAEALRAAASREDLNEEAREAGTDREAPAPAPAWATADLGVSRSELQLSGRFDRWAELEAARAEGTNDPALQARLWVEVARIHLSRPDPEPDRARTALRRAVALHPLYAPALEHLLRLEVRAGRWTEAARTLAQLDRVGGGAGPAGELELMGARIHAARDEPEASAQWSRRALERDPDALPAWRALAEISEAAAAELRRRLDPQLDREELARLELAAARRALADHRAADAGPCVERALAYAPDLAGAWTLRRKIAEASGADETQRLEARVMEALHVDDPEVWRATWSTLEAAGDEGRMDRLASALVGRADLPADLRPRAIAFLRQRGRHAEALQLLEQQGGFSTAPEPTAEELAEWAKHFEARGRPGDIFRLVAHAGHHGLAEPVLAGLAPPTEEASAVVAVQLWLSERVEQLDRTALADPRVQAGVTWVAERQPTSDLARVEAEAERAKPERRFRALEHRLERDPFDLATLDAFAEITTGERRARILALRGFLATGEGRWDPAGSDLERVAARFPGAPLRAGADALGLSSFDDIVEGTPGPGPGVTIEADPTAGFGVRVDANTGTVHLGWGWFDHAPPAERRYAAVRGVLAHLFGSDTTHLEEATLWATRDLGAAFGAIRRTTFRGLVEGHDDPRQRTEVLRRDPVLRALFAGCARGEPPRSKEDASGGNLLGPRAFGTPEGG